MYTLEITMNAYTFAIGTYRRPVVTLLRDDDPTFSEVVASPTLWLDTAVGYLLDSALGSLVVGSVEGDAVLWAKTTVDGQDIYGSVAITVDADYNWGIERQGVTDQTGETTSPFAQYSGYNKGVKRPFSDQELVRSEDVVNTIPVGVPNSIDILTERPVGSLTFDAEDFSSVSKTGYGFAYGYNFGEVGEIVDGTD